MHPIAQVSINGAPVAGWFWSKLIDLSVTDKEGRESDTLKITLEDGPPNHIPIPSKRAIIQVWLG